jgi:hypothetical protein
MIFSRRYRRSASTPNRVHGLQCDILMCAPWDVASRLRRPPPDTMLTIVASGERLEQGPPIINIARVSNIDQRVRPQRPHSGLITALSR